MFRITARLMCIAFRIPIRSPLTSVIPALSMATSVPVPIAMPTSAAAKAGASLIPSPAMATVVAGAHDYLQLHGVKFSNRFSRGFLDWIGNPDYSECLAIDGHPHGGLRFFLQDTCLVFQLVRNCHA